MRQNLYWKPIQNNIWEYRYNYPPKSISYVDRIKRLSNQVLEQHKDKFTADFSGNKKLLDQLAIVRSKGLKNEMAGYITKLVKREKDYLASKQAPIEKEEVEEIDEIEAEDEIVETEQVEEDSDIPQEITVDSGEES
jgi:small subunit ribosomal protein S17e